MNMQNSRPSTLQYSRLYNTRRYMYRRFEHVLSKLGRVEKNRKINHLSQQTELIHGNVFNNDVKHSNAQLLGYKSLVKIVYTFTICYGCPRRKT